MEEKTPTENPFDLMKSLMGGATAEAINRANEFESYARTALNDLKNGQKYIVELLTKGR